MRQEERFPRLGRIRTAALGAVRRLPHHALWIPIAAFAALDGVPSNELHPPLAAASVLLGAAWSYRQARIERRGAARRISGTINALRRQARSYERDATTDRLTGLPNRRTFYQALESLQPTESEGEAKYGAVVLIIDLNSFKLINDRFGHHIGDMALLHFARVLRQETREADLCARIGGDEFAVLLERALPEGARRLANRIASAASSRPVYVGKDGREVWLTVSIGTAAVADYPDIGSALIAADRELYQAKARIHGSAA